MAFGFKKTSAKPGTTALASKASANPQPATAPAPRVPTIELHPPESLKKSPVFPSAAVVANITPEQIRARAYEIFVARGNRPGDSLSDWCQAERELRSAPAGSIAAATPSR